jgi:hypothetical protein
MKILTQNELDKARRQAKLHNYAANATADQKELLLQLFLCLANQHTFKKVVDALPTD